MKTVRGFKLVRLRKDGTYGPLFMNRRQRLEPGKWLPAEDHRTKGFKHRPGWHLTKVPVAPHLSTKDRIWIEVEVKDYQEIQKPVHQGGEWILANWMKVIGPMEVAA